MSDQTDEIILLRQSVDALTASNNIRMTAIDAQVTNKTNEVAQTAVTAKVNEQVNPLVQQAALSATSAHDSLVASQAIEAALPSSAQFGSMKIQLDAITADPTNAVTELWLPGKMFDPIINTNATFGPVYSRLSGWTLPNAVVSYIGVPLRLPSNWATMNVDFVFANLANNAGNVSISAEMHNWAVGETVNATPSGAGVIGAVTPTSGVASILSTGALPVVSSKFTTMRIFRSGTSSNDTLPNGIVLFGVRLRRAS